ncbi:helix-turn-helix transcriptional regulator [Salinigranum sp. GCM10025319]|uniref:helix-turn-helix transcriptional regulator n=1 Tax=Salinigranum sp. GCM10025319 TaxID=3252687 RepID=UPI003607A73D
MSPWDDTTPDVRRLLRQRADVLAALIDAARDKADLTAELDVSRSTVDRTVRRLALHGLVLRTDAGLEATRAGRLAYDSYRRFREETADVERVADLLDELSPSADVSHDLLAGATVCRSEPPATGRPANEVTALLGEAIELWACASSIADSAASERLYRMVTERDGRATVVYTSPLADHLRKQYSEKRREMVETGRYRAYEIDDLSYDLFVVESAEGTQVAVVVYDEGGSIAGTIHNDRDAAVEWGRAVFERRRVEATEFSDDFRDDSEDGPTSTGA